MSNSRKTGKLGCGFWLAFLMLFIIMTSSGVSVKAFFMAVGFFVVGIAVVVVIQEKRKKK